MAPRCLLQHRDDLALARAVAPAPSGDRLAAEAVGDGVEHRLHLTRKPRENEDVLDDETGGAAERVVERLRPARQACPAGRVVPEPSGAEALPQTPGYRRDLLAREIEARRHSLSGDVVRSAPEASRDEDESCAGAFEPQKRRDLVHFVAHGGHQLHLDPQAGETPSEPRSVRVLYVPRNDLVADGENRRGALRALHKREYR